MGCVPRAGDVSFPPLVGGSGRYGSVAILQHHHPIVGDTFLLVRLGSHTLAIAAAAVAEVAPAVEVAPLPGAPAAVEGMVRYRGAVVPVLDVAGRLGLARRPVALDEHLVVVTAGGRTAAFRVHEALRLVTLDGSALAAAEPLAPGARCLRAAAAVDDAVVWVHDPARFLAPDEATRLDEALARLAEAAS